MLPGHKITKPGILDSLVDSIVPARPVVTKDNSNLRYQTFRDQRADIFDSLGKSLIGRISDRRIKNCTNRVKHLDDACFRKLGNTVKVSFVFPLNQRN